MKKLHVPFNGDLEILNLYSEWKNSIQEIYFPANPTIFPSARRLNFPSNYDDYVDKIISFCKENKINSTLLLNGSNFSLLDEDFHKLQDYLNLLVSKGLDIIVLANPLLANWIKTNWPTLTIRLSIISGVNTVTKILNIYETGCIDEICLPPEANRNLDLLKFIKKNCPKLKISLLVSGTCRGGCPMYNWHQAESSSVPKDYKNSEHQIIQNEIWNNIKKLNSSFLQNPAIFPSELKWYDKYVDGFKIEGRQFATRQMENIIPHYALGVNPEFMYIIAPSVCLTQDKTLRIEDLDKNWLLFRRNCQMKCIDTCPFYLICRKGQYKGGTHEINR